MFAQRSVSWFAACLFAAALSGCHAREQRELQTFVGDVHTAVESLSRAGDTGTLTLHVDAWQAGIAILPPHGSAQTFGLPEAIARDMEHSASSSATPRVFLIRDGSVVADEPLDSALQVTPGYSASRVIYFELTHPKHDASGAIQMRMI